MQRIDRGVGLALILLAVAVLWSARAFPNVPGQKLGAGFLPMLVGAGLLACGIALALRRARVPPADGEPPPVEHFGSAAVILGAVAAYVLLADKVGFLLLAPVLLVGLLRSLAVAWVPATAWALGGTLLVHVAFYKLLRVPLPWGWLRPFY